MDGKTINHSMSNRAFAAGAALLTFSALSFSFERVPEDVSSPDPVTIGANTFLSNHPITGLVSLGALAAFSFGVGRRQGENAEERDALPR